jgi:hypothetical protein
MADERQKILGRVRALLDQAEGKGVTPEEAEAFSAKAAALLAKYGLDMAILAATRPEADGMGGKKIATPPPYAEAKYTLLVRVGQPMRLQTVLLKERGYDGKNRWYYRVHLIGYRSDIERAELLYTSLSIQAFNALQHVALGAYGMRKSADRDSWMDGYSYAINQRLIRIEAGAQTAAEQTTPGVGIVLADRNTLARQEAERLYPDLTRGRGRQLSGRLRTEGYQAGQRADLGRTGSVGSGSRRPIS